MIDFQKGLGISQRMLEAAEVRARVILHNIANQNTPGFKRYAVSFEDRLREAHASGKPLGDVHPLIQRDLSGPRGENNVSLVQELADLEKVKLVHDLFVRRVGGYFSHLNKAIRGRG